MLSNSSVMSKLMAVTFLDFMKNFVCVCGHRPEDLGELNLFEELRETIYTEVATLISQNESRPQYLLSLFRELQGLTSDLMRQRAIFALQEIVQTTLKTEVENSREVRVLIHNVRIGSMWLGVLHGLSHFRLLPEHVSYTQWLPLLLFLVHANTMSKLQMFHHLRQM